MKREALRAALERIRREAEDAVREGRELIILTDENQMTDRVAIPMILATGAVPLYILERTVDDWIRSRQQP